MTIKELCDSSNEYSVTRWAFVLVIRFSLCFIACSTMGYIILHMLGKTLDLEFFKYIIGLSSVPTAIISTIKGVQGFEPKTPKNTTKKKNITDDYKNSDDGK